VDRGKLRLTAAVVYDEDVVAGLADAEVERAGLSGCGNGENTVGETGAQVLQAARVIRARRTVSEPDCRSKPASTRAGFWRRLTSTYFHSRGDPVDLVHQFHVVWRRPAGGSRQGRSWHRGDRPEGYNKVHERQYGTAWPVACPDGRAGLDDRAELGVFAAIVRGVPVLRTVEDHRRAGWAVRMVQAKVPEPLGVAAALTSASWRRLGRP